MSGRGARRGNEGGGSRVAGGICRCSRSSRCWRRRAGTRRRNAATLVRWRRENEPLRAHVDRDRRLPRRRSGLRSSASHRPPGRGSPRGTRSIRRRRGGRPRSRRQAGAIRCPVGRPTSRRAPARRRAAFSERPSEMGSRLCRHGSRPGGQPPRAKGASGARERVRVALLGECDGWASRLVAVHVIGHESMHLAGVVDERTADCLAVPGRRVRCDAARCGCDFARSLAREYWTALLPGAGPPYRSADCRDGGRSICSATEPAGRPRAVPLRPLARTLLSFSAATRETRASRHRTA